VAEKLSKNEEIKRRALEGPRGRKITRGKGEKQEEELHHQARRNRAARLHHAHLGNAKSSNSSWRKKYRPKIIAM